MEAFVADLSHELKNPVAAIKAASEVLRRVLLKSRLKETASWRALTRRVNAQKC